MSAEVGEAADQRSYEKAAGILTRQEALEKIYDIPGAEYQSKEWFEKVLENYMYGNTDESVNRDDYNQYETAKEQVLSQDKDPVITIEGDTRPPQTDVEAPPLDDGEVDVVTGDDDPDNTVDPDVDYEPVVEPKDTDGDLSLIHI